MVPREPQKAQDGTQERQGSPTWLNIVNNMPPGGPKMATRRFQVLSETPLDSSKSPKSVKSRRNMYVLCLLAVLLPTR
eukprot:388157-Pyramimonas_sp.AAC.1